MKKTLSGLIEKFQSEASHGATGSIEFLNKESALQVRGGDREYVPMYESNSTELEWGKISLLVDSLK